MRKSGARTKRTPDQFKTSSYPYSGPKTPQGLRTATICFFHISLSDHQ